MTDKNQLAEVLTDEANEETTAPEVSDEGIEESDVTEEPNELDVLRAEIAELKQALAQKNAEADLIKGQLEEMREFFPNVAPEDIPAEVWASITNGGSLAAAYALYHRKEQLHRDRVRELNDKNAELSTGKVGVDSAKEYFTPSDVRAMSRSEVRANYSKILNSMKKWN